MRFERSLHPRLLGGFVQGLAIIAMTFLLASATVAGPGTRSSRSRRMISRNIREC